MTCNDRSHFTGSPSRTMAEWRRNTRRAGSRFTLSRVRTIDGSEVFVANETLTFDHVALEKISHSRHSDGGLRTLTSFARLP